MPPDNAKNDETSTPPHAWEGVLLLNAEI